MSSSKGSKSGKYVGNGGSAPIQIKTGFKPELVKIYSADGIVVMQENMPVAKKFTDAAGPADLAASDLVLQDFGFQVANNVAGVNSSGVAYYWELF